MARCGCTGSCSCVIQGSAPIVVTGNGSVQQQYIIGLAYGGKTGCAAIAACVGENLGPGLVYDPGTGDIQLKLSTDDGQVARFGSDQGILVTDGTGPTPAICVHGIASLPAAPNVVGAALLAQLMGPPSAPSQVDYCLATGCDIMSFRVASSSDEVGVVTELDDHRISDQRTSIYNSHDIAQLSAATVQSVYNYAGDVDDPVAFVIPVGGDRTDRRGGWYGWLAQRYYQPLAADFLAKINGKSVALLNCTVGSGANYPESVAIRGAIRAVLEYCAQEWSFIGVAELANATTVLNAGIVPIVCPAAPALWGTTALPYTTASLTGAGIQWIALSDRYADSVFTTYRAAGLNVLMDGNSRHSQRARVTTLNIRGALADDPVYYRGPNTAAWPYDYRRENHAWERRRISTGMLTFRTDARGVSSGTGAVRGRTEAAESGLIIAAGYGSTVERPGILCGWECPLTDASNYRIEWSMKWNTLATVSTVRAQMGVLFGAATDRDTYAWPQANPTLNPQGFPDGQRTLYRAYQRQNGEIGIAKWATSTSAITFLATTASPAIAAGFYNAYTLTVTPTQITFTRTTIGGTQYTVTAADSQYRGGYFWVEKQEGAFGDSANPFEGKFLNVTYTDL